MANGDYKNICRRNMVTGDLVTVHEHVFICLLKDGLWQKGITSTPDGYDIHHIDFKPSNNDPLNLVMLTRSEHMKVHSDWYKEHGNTKGEKQSKSLKQFWMERTEEEKRGKMKAAKAKAVEKMLTEGPTEKQLSGLEKARAVLKAKREAARLERESK